MEENEQIELKAQSQKTAILKSLEIISNSVVETLSKGDRAELIPVKDGVKVVRVRREELKK